MEERGTELERNKFQLRIGWNRTERVPVQGWVERNGTSSRKIGTEYNTVDRYVDIPKEGERLGPGDRYMDK